MELIKTYPPQLKEWKHGPNIDFTGDMEEPAEQYILEITPPEPSDKDFMYFNVTVKKEILNPKLRKQLFSAIIYYHYKVKTNNESPTPEFYFTLIESAAVSFAIYYYENIKKTNLKGHKIKKPLFETLRGDIENAIDVWKKS